MSSFKNVSGPSCPASSATALASLGSKMILSSTDFDLNGEIETGDEAKLVHKKEFIEANYTVTNISCALRHMRPRAELY